jgi:hypothetical protein
MVASLMARTDVNGLVIVFSESDRKCSGQRKWSKTSLCSVRSWEFVSWEIRIQDVVCSDEPSSSSVLGVDW